LVHPNLELIYTLPSHRFNSNRASVNMLVPRLGFSGSVAICSLYDYNPSQEQDLILELCQGQMFKACHININSNNNSDDNVHLIYHAQHSPTWHQFLAPLAGMPQQPGNKTNIKRNLSDIL